MKNKAMISWMLVAALLLGCMIFPASAEGEMRLESIVAIEEEIVWLDTSVGLAPFDKEGWQIDAAIYPEADTYAVGKDGNIYYSIDGDIFAFDRDGNAIDTWETQLDKIKKLLVNDAYILALGSEAYVSVHMESHALAGGVANELTDIAFFGEDTHVLIDGATTVICDNATLDVVHMLVSSADGIIVSSSEEEGIYWYRLGGISCLSSVESVATGYMSLPDKNYVDDVLMDDEAVYAIYKGELCSYPRPAENAEQKVLTLVGGSNQDIDMRFTKTVEIFTQRHPEYTVKTTGYEYDKEKIKTAIMANDPGYDILVFSFNGGAEIKVSDMLMDLSENTVIAENIAQWLEMPFLWESDGSLYGIPAQIYPYGFRIQKALWDELGLDIDRDWTWDDFFALAEVAKEYGLKLTNDDKVWRTMRGQYESKYRDYIAGEANYETDTFRKLAEMWKQLDADKMLAYEYYERKNVLLEFDLGIMWKDDRSRYVYLGMPTLDGEYVTPIGIEGFYVNRFGENAEDAVEFLEIYTSPEVQGWACGGINTLMDDVRNNLYFGMYEEMGYLHVFEDMIPTDEEMDDLKFALKTGRLNESFGNLDYVGTDVIQDFIKDRLTLDEFVAEVQERADLMIGE
ncbi:MAG: extracellular solute-binding protein [Clostridiales bacterium]|nr:extracellular solute-binding protein [Clostridiales bacterium]